MHAWRNAFYEQHFILDFNISFFLVHDTKLWAAARLEGSIASGTNEHIDGRVVGGYRGEKETTQ